MPHRLNCACVVIVAAVLAVASSVACGQTGSIHEPVRYVGGPVVQQNAHDGQLRPAIGVESFQVMRANRTHPEQSDGLADVQSRAKRRLPEQPVLRRIPEQPGR
jgi:hypothetical protein